jgi:hypothetical protein
LPSLTFDVRSMNELSFKYCSDIPVLEFLVSSPVSSRLEMPAGLTYDSTLDMQSLRSN